MSGSKGKRRRKVKFQFNAPAAGPLKLAARQPRWVLGEFLGDLVTMGLGREAVREQVSASLQYLTPRELEVLLLIVDGLTDRQIAVRMSVTRETVRTHVKRIREKLGVSNRAYLRRMLLDLGLRRRE